MKQTIIIIHNGKRLSMRFIKSSIQALLGKPDTIIKIKEKRETTTRKQIQSR